MSEFFEKALDELTGRRRDFIWSLIGAIMSLWIVASCLKVTGILNTVDPSWLLLPANMLLLFLSVFFFIIAMGLIITSLMMLTNPDGFKD